MTPRPRVQVNQREWVVPATPTPSQKKTTSLSDWDTVMYKSYTPLLLFYTNDEKDPDFMNTETLKSSLSAVLDDFYPLAGRLVDIGNGRDEIDNCDAGVLFQEAEYQGGEVQAEWLFTKPNGLSSHVSYPFLLLTRRSLVCGTGHSLHGRWSCSGYHDFAQDCRHLLCLLLPRCMGQEGERIRVYASLV